MPKPRVLIVEDDPRIVDLLRWHFEQQDFRVQSTPDGEEALLLARETGPDLVILDWMLLSLSGIEVCRRLRRMPDTANVPIIMVTARAEESERLRGLETGADDYITKPFSPKEVVARAHAVLRRVRPAIAEVTLTYADLQLDATNHKAKRAGRTLSLGPTEFRLLRHLMENPGRVFSRERLLDSVWGHNLDIDARTVDVHVRRLRRELNADGGRDLIRTVRSAGYSLDSEG